MTLDEINNNYIKKMRKHLKDVIQKSDELYANNKYIDEEKELEMIDQKIIEMTEDLKEDLKKYLIYIGNLQQTID